MALKPNLILENSVLKVRNNLVTLDEQRTYVTTAVSAGATTLTVQNITGFSTSDYLILGHIGEEKTEIVQVHASTSPSGTTITLTSAGAIYDHPVDTPVQRISYNRVEFSRATSSGGSKSVLATTALAVDQEFTVYNDTSNTTGYAYARFNNSTSSTNSAYSDEQAYSSQTYNSVGTIINRVMSLANERTEGFVTRREILDYLWNFIDVVNDLRTRWKHEEVASDKSNTTTTGGETFTVPTDMKYSSDRSIIAVYVEGQSPLKYVGQIDFVNELVDQPRTQLNGAVLTGATSITLDDATNFGDSGTGYVAGDEFTWTGRSGNTLSGVSGILAHADGDIVVENSVIGTPEIYTVIDGVGHIWPTPDTDNDNRPLVIDYYERVEYPDSENDTLPVPYISPAIEFCLMRIEDKRGIKFSASSEKYRSRFERQITQVIRNERTGQPQYFKLKE